jgi:hypothetical protein
MNPPQIFIQSTRYSFEHRKLMVWLTNGVFVGIPLRSLKQLDDLAGDKLNPVTVEQGGMAIRFTGNNFSITQHDLFDLVRAAPEGNLLQHEPQPKTPFKKESNMSNKPEYFRDFTGLASSPDRQVADSHVFVFNPCSVKGGWDEDLGQQLASLDGVPQAQYNKWLENGKYADTKNNVDVSFELGNIQLANFKASPNVIVVNALVKDVSEGETVSSTRYWAVSQALNQLYERLFLAKQEGRPVEVHFQNSELHDSTDWHVMAILIQELAVDYQIFTTVNHPE